MSKNKVMMITSPGWNLVRMDAGDNTVDVVFEVTVQQVALGFVGFVDMAVAKYIPNVDPDSILGHYVFKTEQAANNYVQGIDTCATCYKLGTHQLLLFTPPSR